MTLFCILAAAAGAALLFGWVGYPVILRLFAARRAPRRMDSASTPLPLGISVVIATREAPDVIRKRLLNVHACELAGAPLEIVIAVDRGSPFAVAAYQDACGALGRVVPGDAPGGKACTLNAAVRESAFPYLVFADSMQSFTPTAIRELVRRFTDPTVGSVTGTLRFGDGSSTSPVLKLFWAYELALREMESVVDSVVAVTGAIHALRREFWRPLPAGVICDDLFIPMYVVRQGHRVVSAPESFALDDRRFTRAQEFSRKVRTLTGMIQFCALCPWALSPFGNRIWGQFVCHKLLRLSTPYLLIVAVVGGALCLRGPVWFWPAVALLSLLLAVALLLAPESSRLRKLRGHLLWTGYLLAAPVVATLHAIRGNWDIWSPPRERRAA